MSRPVSITSALTLIPASYNTSLSNNITTGTSQSPSNGLNSSANTSSYAGFSGVQGTSGYAYYDFTVTGIPSVATINSVSCVARSRASYSGTTRGTVGLQLCTNTTPKGSETTVTSTTTTAYTLTPGSWTASEVQNIKIRIRVYRSRSNNYAARFYGASLTINYTINSTEYEVTATSTYTGATVSPASQWVMSGDNGTVSIFPDDLNNITVEDNGTDVTNQLQYVTPTPSGSFTGVPVSFDYTNSVYDTTSGNSGVYSTNYIENGFAGSSSTTRCALYSMRGSGAVSKMYYNFDCSSVPQNATITSVSCSFKGGTQGTTYYSSYIAQLCAGTTQKGTSQSITGSNTAATTVTIDGGANWTRDELDDIKILFQVTRGTQNTNSGSTWSFYGATLTVNYTTPANPYYTYTITNISADHSVVVGESIIVPPEEDPEKTYYSLTISSINATTDPGRGTVRVESGTGQTITITPSDPQITLVTDNGVDITNQLVAHGGAIPTPTVETAPGASYGFTYSASTGYYYSANKGVDKTAAVCKVNFDLPVRCLVTFDFINYAEGSYDFGVFGEIDVALSNNYYAAGSGGATITDSTYRLACNTSTYNKSSVQTITYEVPAGEHSIYIKFSKDDATAENNDNLQFKIANIEALEPNNYYTYTLSNISADHSLIFIFGDVTYYFVNSSTDSNARLYPDGQMVQLPGDTYKLVIVPETSGDTISARDNGTDITSSLVRKEETITKSGVTETVVNYVYTLNNIQTGHTIVVYSSSPGDTPFLKRSGSWSQLNTIYKKVNGRWEEQEISIDIFDSGTIYIEK